MYTSAIARPKGYRPRHAVENQWDLLAAVDSSLAAKASREEFPAQMWAGPDDARAVSAHSGRVISSAPLLRLVVLHVSAGNPFRRWPESSFATLAARLVTAADDRVVLVTAGPSDRDAAGRVLEAARVASGARANRIVAADALSLGALRALLDRAALFIGGDSGPLHIASTSGAPIVGIYGPTRPERSAPWRPAAIPTASVEPGPLLCRPCDQRVCIPGDFRCLSEITSSAVAEAAERLLGAKP